MILYLIFTLYLMRMPYADYVREMSELKGKWEDLIHLKGIIMRRNACLRINTCEKKYV